MKNSSAERRSVIDESATMPGRGSEKMSRWCKWIREYLGTRRQ